MLARAPKTETDDGLKAVFAAIESGKHAIRSKSQLGKALAVTRQAISGWSKVPAEHVVQIEDMLGVPAHVQRGDIFRSPKKKKK
jgi:hypothetical protein